MAKYNHAVTLAFEVVSLAPNGGDLIPATIKAALLLRIAELDEENTWLEAIGAPFDTYQVEESENA